MGMQSMKQTGRTTLTVVFATLLVMTFVFAAVAGQSAEGNPVKTVELTVNGIWSAPENNGVDLDGLQLLTRPDGIDKWDADKQRQWLRDNGYDLSIDLNERGVWLHAVDTNIVAVPSGKWDEKNLSWIASEMAPGSASGPLVFWELPADLTPITFAFRTRNGASGILRVVAYSQEERTATIQVKLDG